MSNTTIAAISTGMTPSGIAIIRITGPDALSVADRIFAGKRPISKAKSHTIHYGNLVQNGVVIDEVLVSVMRAPHTFTGEDTVEINSHGGILVAKQILEICFENGAKPAAPGEFTKRAFLNGRMDLAKAEAVMDVISAKSNFALRAGVHQLKGSVSEKIRDLRSRILDECAFIEAALDDPEHYDLMGYGEVLSERLVPIEAELNDLITRADFGTVLKEGVRTAICGRPNAGKSSLLNLLSGEEKAIVTDIAGTTRDVLEVPVILKDISLILMDTAGLRETDDKVESIGVSKAKEVIESADLVLYLIDALTGMTDEDRDILRTLPDKPVIVLLNKTDLLSVRENGPDLECDSAEEKVCVSERDSAVECGYVSERISELENELKLLVSRASVIPFSCKNGSGRAILEERILDLFGAAELTDSNETVITSARHAALLKDARESLSLVQDGIENMLSEEFLTVDLVNAYRALGEIIGEEVTDDVIDRVFEKFCMGK